MKDKHVGMLLGGHNSEHEVSMRTGAALGRALREKGYRVTDIVVGPDLPQQLLREKIEVAFIALHGRWGEDGCVQGLLEVMRIPYSGSGVLSSALGMDKIASKKLFRQAGLPVADEVVVPKQEVAAFDPGRIPFPYPVVVKPSCEGSSVGVSIVHDRSQLGAALAEAAKHAGDVLIERYIKGREINIGVLDDRALGCIEVIPAEEFYSYKAKYQSGGTTRYVYPAPLSGMETRVREVAVSAHRALGCCGVTRVELILAASQEMFLLEVNTIPGMTETSLVPKIAAGAGIPFADLAERLLLGAALKG